MRLGTRASQNASRDRRHTRLEMIDIPSLHRDVDGMTYKQAPFGQASIYLGYPEPTQTHPKTYYLHSYGLP